MNRFTSSSRGARVLAILLGACATAPSAFALTLTPDFGVSITSNTNATQIESSIDAAISTIDGLYGNTVTIPVNFTYLPGAAGNLLSTNGNFQDISYSSYVSALQTDAAANPGNTVLALALANLSKGNDANGASDLAISSALAALLTGSTPTAATININSTQPFGFTQPVTSSNDDLTGGLEHELDEVLGGGGAGTTLNSVAGSCTTAPSGFFCNKIGPLDPYRYSAAATPTLSTSGTATSYFSIDGGTTNIVYFNQNTGGDLADFAGNLTDPSSQCAKGSPSGPGQLIQNAFNCTGPDEPYTSLSPEYTMLESIGYDPIPEPATLAILGTATFALFMMRRRNAAR